MTSSRVEIWPGFPNAADDCERFIVSTDGHRIIHFVLGIFPSSEIAERSGSGREDGRIGAADEPGRDAQGLVGQSKISKHVGVLGHDTGIVWMLAPDLPTELVGEPQISDRPGSLGYVEHFVDTQSAHQEPDIQPVENGPRRLHVRRLLVPVPSVPDVRLPRFPFAFLPPLPPRIPEQSQGTARGRSRQFQRGRLAASQVLGGGATPWRTAVLFVVFVAADARTIPVDR